MNLLVEKFISTVSDVHGLRQLSLPGLMAALARGEIQSYPAQRAHQRHATHALLCQLAALALHNAQTAALPETESGWSDLLRNLTSGFPDDEPWCLVSPVDKPAFLQAPIPSGNLGELKKLITTPDALDMLVTSKNHDLKQAVMVESSAEDWFFALLTLQTMEGFLGAGNYGVSRMNGGFANRPAVSLAPSGGLSAQWRRDVHRLLALRDKILPNIYQPKGGLGLVWLEPWDGTNSLNPEQLDPLYIEICRRVRIQFQQDHYVAYAGSSKAARIKSTAGGITGDPWAPIVDAGEDSKVLTIDGRGLGYQKMVDLLFSPSLTHALLQDPTEDDDKTGLSIIARALVRGQGKTEGYHERRVQISRKTSKGFSVIIHDHAAKIANERVRQAGEMRKAVLKPALFSLFQNGPVQIDFQHKESERRAKLFLDQFDAAIDRDFFDDLWAEIEDPESEQKIRKNWIHKIFDQTRILLKHAEGEVARSSRRSTKALVRARDKLENAAKYNEHFKEYLLKDAEK